MRSPLIIFCIFAISWFGIFILGPRWSPIEAVIWKAPSNPGLTPPFQPNNKLATITLIHVGNAPEHVACGLRGNLYTGLEGGVILRSGSDGIWHTLASTGGRPLGLRADNEGGVWVADALKGILHIDNTGQIESLIDSQGETPLLFVDDLDVDRDGNIWFSDASKRFGYRNVALDFYEGSSTGRLLKFNPTTKSLEVMIEGLFFANGVTLGPNEEYILVNETGMGRVHRLWLKGELTGQRDIFLDKLPGTPDNIRFDGKDTFWIAMPALRATLDMLAPLPTVRSFLSYLPAHFLEFADQASSFVIGINSDGKVVHNLQDTENAFHYITGVTPCGNQLYLGSLRNNAIGVMPIPGFP